MNKIPDQYFLEHKEHQKFINQQNDNYLDQYFYKIEDTFIFPYFENLKETRKMVRHFYEANDSSELKQKIRVFARKTLENHEIDIDNFQKTKIYFNKVKKKNLNYYNHNSMTLSINELNLIESVKDKKRLSLLLYTILHEIAHAHSHNNKPFCSGHSFTFLHSLTIILGSFSLCEFPFYSQWSSKKIECDDGVFRDFNEYCQNDGIFYPLTTNFVSCIVANTIEDVVSFANKEFDGNIVLSVDKNGVSEYELHQKRKEILTINKGHAFNEYSICVSRRRNGVFGFILNEREYFENSQKFYINFLKKKHEEKNFS